MASAAPFATPATTWDDAPVVLLDRSQQGAAIELETLLHDASAFALEPHFNFVADTAVSGLRPKLAPALSPLPGRSRLRMAGYRTILHVRCLALSDRRRSPEGYRLS